MRMIPSLRAKGKTLVLIIITLSISALFLSFLPFPLNRSDAKTELLSILRQSHPDSDKRNSELMYSVGRRRMHSVPDGKFSCLDPEAMPWTVGVLKQLQNRCLTDGTETRYLMWEGFGGGLGLGASLFFSTGSFLAALLEDRVFAQTGNTPTSNSFYMEPCGKRTMLECHFEPITECPFPGKETTLSEPKIVSEEVLEHFRNFAEDDILKVTPDTYNSPKAHDAQVVFLDSSPKRLVKDYAKVGLSIITGDLKIENMPDFEAVVEQYILRPNAQLREHVRLVLEESRVLDVDPSETISLPIRGSDKCHRESTCPPFAAYMKVCNAIKKLNPNVKNIILTSEDPEYLNTWPQWSTGEEGRDWNFILNTRDVNQGTGGNIGKKQSGILQETFDQEVSKGDIMNAMMSSLYLQLHGQYLVLMCHSNWHKLLERFAKAGCSSARKVVVICVGDQLKLGVHQCHTGNMAMCKQADQEDAHRRAAEETWAKEDLVIGR